MDDSETALTATAEWLESLARSDAEIAAGMIESGDDVMQELEDAIARLEAAKAAKPQRC